MIRLLLVCAFIFSISLAAQERAGSEGDQHSQHAAEDDRSMGAMRQGRMHSMIRHQYVMREGIPEAYEELVNPLTPTETVLASGQQVYTEVCSTCHGVSGDGDGPAGAALDPSPSNIGRLPRMPMMSSDAYLYWTVAEGGVPIQTAMPAFKQMLTPDQIWSVILYVREGL
jgi:mono/diheme cytochrome c family protein